MSPQPLEPGPDGDALPAVRQRATGMRWVMFGAAALTSFLLYVHRYAWGTTRPLFKDEYNLSDQELGWLDAAFNLTYALGQVPGGWAGDALGPRLVIPIAMVLWSLMMIGPALTGRYWGLLAARLAFGATQAPCYPNLGKVTKSWFSPRIRTSLQGVVASFAGRAGGAVAPFLIGTVLIASIGLTWQQALYVLAAVGLLLAVGFWLVFRNRPSDHPWCNEAERELLESEGGSQSGGGRIQWTLPNVTNLGVFMGAAFCSTFADNLFVFYMPQFLMEEKGFSVGDMGKFAGLPILGGAVGGMFGGVLNDVLIRWTGNPRVARSLVAAGGKTIAAGLIAASLLAGDGRLVMLVLFFCKFFSDWSQPTFWGAVTDIGGPATGRVFGILNMVGSIGATVAGPVMGYVLGYFGWTTLFLFVGSVYLMTAVFWSFVNCTRRLVAS